MGSEVGLRDSGFRAQNNLKPLNQEDFMTLGQLAKR